MKIEKTYCHRILGDRGSCCSSAAECWVGNW